MSGYTEAQMEVLRTAYVALSTTLNDSNLFTKAEMQEIEKGFPTPPRIQ